MREFSMRLYIPSNVKSYTYKVSATRLPKHELAVQGQLTCTGKGPKRALSLYTKDYRQPGNPESRRDHLLQGPAH